MSPTLDLLTFGETMVLFAPSERGTLESAPAYHVSIGGAESNCAIGLARLGYSVAWVSRLGHDPFGARVLKTIRGEGVDALGLGGGLIPKSNDEFDQCAALAYQLLEVALKARDSR